VTGGRQLGGRGAPRAGRWLLWVVILLLAGGVAAQDTAADEEAVESEPGVFEDPLEMTSPVFLEGNSTGEQLEIVIHLWSGVLPALEEDESEHELPEEDEAVEAGPQSFVVSVGDYPSFIQNVSWIDGPELVFEPGESSKTVTLVFDTTAEGEAGLPEEEAELVLFVDARDDEIKPGRRELVVPLIFKRALIPEESTIMVCALRSDTPEDFPIEEAYAYCDPERTPVLRYDRVVVFFTPERDLREPVGQAQAFLWQIVDSGGKRIRGGAFSPPSGDADESEEAPAPFTVNGAPNRSMHATVEGSPGRFAVEVDLWGFSDDADRGPAGDAVETFTVQTAGATMEPTEVFGQGGTSAQMDGEWQDEGSFEVADRAFEFNGFVAERAVLDEPLLWDSRLREGVFSLGEPQVNGTRVTVEMSARWRWHAKEAAAASSRLVLELPQRIRAGKEAAGEVSISLEPGGDTADSSDFVFTAGLFTPVATTARPPTRSLAAMDGGPPLWGGRRDARSPGHEAADGSGCSSKWVWRQGQADISPDTEPTEGRCSVIFEGGSRSSEPWGVPARDLASHLHDPETLLVLPVFLAVRGGSHQVDLRTFGYALYGVGAEPYDGPKPDDALEVDAGPGAPPVLELLRIEASNLSIGDIDHSPGSPGFSRRDESRYAEGSLQSRSVASARLADFPTEISLGEPIRIAADVAKSVTFASEAECDRLGGAGGHLYAANFGGSYSSTGCFISKCPADHPQAESFRDNPCTGGGGSASFELELDSVREDETGTTEVVYIYRSQSSHPADVKGPGDKEGRLYSWDYRYQTDAEGYLVPGVEPPDEMLLRVSAGLGLSEAVVAIYGPVHSLDEGLDPAPSYEHPADATAPPRGVDDPSTDTTDGSDDTPDDRDDGVVVPVDVDDPDITGVETDTEGGSGATATGDTTGVVTVPPGAGGIDPNRPDVAALIAEWIAIAEPPENALHGSDLRYNEWGVKLGTASSGLITGTPGRPDEVGSRSSPEYLWDLREQLDSVDHCFLGEYVEARLGGGGAAGCAGRHRGEVNSLVGLQQATAETRVRDMKWVPVVIRGAPAPSADLTGTVERQDPEPRRRLIRGEAVQIWIYGQPEPARIEVPDLVGSSSRIAGVWLEELGLVGVIVQRTAATTAAQEGTVESQDPYAGARLETGSAVTLYVYGPPRAAVIPTPATADCSRWPGSVQTWDLASGESRCDCPQGTMWDTQGTACVAAVNSDQRYCDRNWPGTAARRITGGVLECQCPPGTGWDDGRRGCVSNAVVPVRPITPQDVGDCRQMPGTIAFRDPGTGRVDCRCPVGSWNSAQHRCVTTTLEPSDPLDCPTYYARIRASRALGNHADAARAAEVARSRGCNPTYIADAIGPTDGGTSGGGPTDGGPTGSGDGCEDLGRQLSEPLYQKRITRRQAEQQMTAAGCGDQLHWLCPSGNFGMSTYPGCLGESYIGPSPSGGAGRQPRTHCSITPMGQNPGRGLVFKRTFDSVTNYYVIAVPEDTVDSQVNFWRTEHGATLVRKTNTYSEALREANALCPNPTSPGGR